MVICLCCGNEVSGYYERVIYCLIKKPNNPTGLKKILKCSFGSIAHELKKLKSFGFVDISKEINKKGKPTIYKLNNNFLNFLENNPKLNHKLTSVGLELRIYGDKLL